MEANQKNYKIHMMKCIFFATVFLLLAVKHSCHLPEIKATILFLLFLSGLTFEITDGVLAFRKYRKNDEES